MTNKADPKILDDMMEFSLKMEKSLGTLYKHNSYQATITAIGVVLAKKFTYLKVPTASGKTFIGGMYYSY